jgi:hypothetical protein
MIVFEIGMFPFRMVSFLWAFGLKKLLPTKPLPLGGMCAPRRA